MQVASISTKYARKRYLPLTFRPESALYDGARPGFLAWLRGSGVGGFLWFGGHCLRVSVVLAGGDLPLAEHRSGLVAEVFPGEMFAAWTVGLLARGRRESLPGQAQARFGGLAAGGKLAGGTRALDQAPPSLVPAVSPGDLAPARQRAVLGPAGQCPLPRLSPKISTRTTLTASALAVRPRPMLTQTLDSLVAAFRAGDQRSGL